LYRPEDREKSIHAKYQSGQENLKYKFIIKEIEAGVSIPLFGSMTR